MARVLLDNVEEVEFLASLTRDESAMLGPAGGNGSYVGDSGCPRRKANIRAKAKDSRDLRRIDNVFIAVGHTGPLKGPNGEEYNLITYDFKRITR